MQTGYISRVLYAFFLMLSVFVYVATNHARAISYKYIRQVRVILLGAVNTIYEFMRGNGFVTVAHDYGCYKIIQ